MKLDLSCPIELRGYTLSCADGVVEASIRLYNLTNRRIASFEAIAKWRSHAQDRGIAMPFHSDRLRAGAENSFMITLVCNRLPEADSLDLVFTAVRFEDGGPDWRAGDGMVVDISPLEPISAENLAALRFAAGEDAVCFPLQTNQTWRCVCGRVNPDEAESCARCHRDYADVTRFTPENVLSQCRPQPEIADICKEDAQIADLHARYLRQKTRLFRRTLAIAFAALVLTALLVIRYSPSDAVNASAEVISIYAQNTPVQED